MAVPAENHCVGGKEEKKKLVCRDEPITRSVFKGDAHRENREGCASLQDPVSNQDGQN